MSATTPAKFTPLYDEIAAFFRSLCVNSPSKDAKISVLAGVSGGADSVALLHLLSYLKDGLSISRLAVAHVNHGLRGEESDGDERFVAAMAESLQIEFFSVKLDSPTGNSGIEHWGRTERYNFFQDIKQRGKFDYIATAHTAGDQAETLILRLMRGTGVRGLRGILPVRGDGVIRPLLGVERNILEKWLESRGLQYRTDSSNADTKFSRNFVRAEIIPKMSEHSAGAVANIAACAESAARAWEVVGEKIDTWVNEYVIRVNDAVFHIEKVGLDDALIAPEALITLFDEYGITASRLHIDRVMRGKSLSSGEHLLPNGWKFYPTEDRVCFVKRQDCF